MDSADIPSLSATELRSTIAREEVSSVEAVEACLERIKRADPKVNAFISVSAEDARQAAFAQLPHRSQNDAHWGVSWLQWVQTNC